MDRIASATFSCPAMSMSRVCRINPCGLNISKKRFSCRVAVASGETTAKVCLCTF